MRPTHAWMSTLGGDPVTARPAFPAALNEQGIVLSEPDSDPSLPGMLLLLSVDESTLAEVVLHASRATGPILALVPRRSDLGQGGAWKLLRAGASDVFVLEECRNPPAAIAARLHRVAEVEELVDSPLVAQNLIGCSRAWRQVIRQAVEVARFSDGSLLITGESGTGKELVARLVHSLDVRPNKGKLITLDCTTVVPELSGSEFFGHERGAFTHAVAVRDGAFALAHQGSLFLDEVGELPLALQAELLRVVQERSYKRVGSNTWQQADFRLVCATNRNLESEEAKGNFRLDFFHRIASSRCHLPPLRERREDILPLARHFVRQARPENLDAEVDFDFAAEVQELLLTREYPGNVRELRQLVLRIVRRHAGPGPITLGAVPEADRASTLGQLDQDWRDESFRNALRRALARGAGLQAIKDETIDAAIDLALADNSGNLQRAAQKLGVTDRALQLRRAARRDSPRDRPSPNIAGIASHGPPDVPIVRTS
ncbi:MAG: sigma-54-dependent transcriptional regulator [Limisphaerales bacterium]